jgi:hypothetical protein
VCYIELAFHSDPADAKSVSEHPELYAKAITAGLLKYGKLAPPAPPAPPPALEVPIPELKLALLTYALTAKPAVSLAGLEGLRISTDAWDNPSRILAWRVSGRLHREDDKVPQSANVTQELAEALGVLK